MSKRKPKRGDIVRVVWLDIVCDAHGELCDADAMRFDSVAKFVEWRKGAHGEVLVTTDTTSKDGEIYGWTCYPAGVVVSLKRIGGTK